MNFSVQFPENFDSEKINDRSVKVLNRFIMFSLNLDFQHKSTLNQLNSVLAQKEEISQRCHELDEQV